MRTAVCVLIGSKSSLDKPNWTHPTASNKNHLIENLSDENQSKIYISGEKSTMWSTDWVPVLRKYILEKNFGTSNVVSLRKENYLGSPWIVPTYLLWMHVNSLPLLIWGSNPCRGVQLISFPFTGFSASDGFRLYQWVRLNQFILTVRLIILSFHLMTVTFWFSDSFWL